MTQPLVTGTGRMEIDSEYPVAFHTGINAWLVCPHHLVMDALRDPRFSTLCLSVTLVSR